MKEILTFAKNKLSNIKNIYTLFSVAFLFHANSSQAQQLVALYKESFPSQCNTSLVKPINQTTSQATGAWTLSSSGNATFGIFPPSYSPSGNALKFVHQFTGASAADAAATSTSFNLSQGGCYSKYDFSFNLYTYNCISGDNNTFLAVDFSKDGGATWTTVWQKTSGQIYSSYGVNTVQNIWLAMPAQYLVSNFKYRFRSHMNANNNNNFYQFIDDVFLWVYSCSDNLSIGNLVWVDTNQNGVKDATEQGKAGIVVKLLRDNDGDGQNDASWTPPTATTDANGNYKFSNLYAGKYLVCLTNVPTNYRLVSVNAGTPDEDGDNNNNGWYQSADYAYVDGGWMTLLPQTEPTSDGDGNNSNLSYDFALAPLASLPVHGLILGATLANNIVKVQWNTINEVSVANFELESSTDGLAFSSIYKVSGTNNATKATYNFADNVASKNASILYYRIKMVDNDGDIKYSNTAVVRLEQKIQINVWPNPFVSDIIITHNAAATSVVSVKIMDNSGKQVKAQTFKVVKGANQFTIDNLSALATGMYIIQITDLNNNAIYSSKIMK